MNLFIGLTGETNNDGAPRATTHKGATMNRKALNEMKSKSGAELFDEALNNPRRDLVTSLQTLTRIIKNQRATKSWVNDLTADERTSDREWLNQVVAAAEAMVSEVKAMLKEGTMASDQERRRVITDHLRLKTRARQLRGQ
jgi:H2-forming N5,N10-methylenetetrahydromethanopterin dehydrogenase-like enzyme